MSEPLHPPPYAGPPPQGVVVGAPTLVVQQGPVVGAAVVPVMVGPHVGPKPSNMFCQSCHQDIVSRVETKASTRTHIFALVLCLVGCWPCVCIPYCIDSCKNADHYCPNCSAYIGSYRH